MYLCGAGHPERTHEDWEQIGYDKGYRKGREDQGEFNADTIREIHELVYQQGIEKGREEAIDDAIHHLDNSKVYCHEDYIDGIDFAIGVLQSIAEQLKEQKNG